MRWPALTLLDGGSWAPAHWQDRAVVVVFFSTTCPYCLRHNSRLQVLADQAAGSALTVLGVALDRDPDAVRTHQRQHGHRFPVTLDEAALRPLLSTRRIMPLTCVIDRAGVLREVIPGEMALDDVQKLMRWALRPA